LAHQTGLSFFCVKTAAYSAFLSKSSKKKKQENDIKAWITAVNKADEAQFIKVINIAFSCFWFYIGL
jgi:hypothetical protein